MSQRIVQAFQVLLGTAILGAAAWYLYFDPARKAKAAPHAPSAAELRAKAGAYIATTKELNESESLSTVVVPSGYGEMLDVKCIIYRNREYRQVVFTCPGVAQHDIDFLDPER